MRSQGERCSGFVLVGACLVLWGGPAARGAETVNRIVAIVNDEVITAADVFSHMQTLLEDRNGPLPEGVRHEDVQRMALQRLIERRLMLQDARREGIQVGTEEILARLEELRGRVSSDEEFEKMLAQEGWSREQLKEQLRDQLMVQKAIDAHVRSAIMVSPQEVAREVAAHPELAKPGDRIRASHILIRVNDTRSEERARGLIQDLAQQLQHGADFSTLAKRYSEDPHRDAGGDMGWVAQGELLPELDAALFSLKAGEVSSPIQSRLGFHVVRVEERRSASSLSLVEANRAVYQQLYQRKFAETVSRWLSELKRKAYIQVLDATGTGG